MKIKLVLVFLFLFCVQARADIVDVFLTTGQSNATWDNHAWGRGIADGLAASGHFENLLVLNTGADGNPVRKWYDLDPNDPQILYRVHFFQGVNNRNGMLGNARWQVESGGDTFRFTGLFWFQGEADGRQGEDISLYDDRWDNMLARLDLDLGTSDYRWISNTVGNSGDEINPMLQSIAAADDRGEIFDTQRFPYKTDPNDVHGYDHYLVGQENARLFVSSFVVPEPNSVLLLTLAVVLIGLRRKR